VWHPKNTVFLGTVCDNGGKNESVLLDASFTLKTFSWSRAGHCEEMKTKLYL
jgi:hypothetical protein